MAQSELLKRYLDVGMAVGQLTRSRAESIVKELVRAGEVQRDRAQEAVDELVDRSRRNTEAISALVRQELKDQIGRLGIATKDDLTRLEARLGGGAAKPKKAAAGASKRTVPAKRTPPAKKKAAAKKAPARKAAGRA